MNAQRDVQISLDFFRTDAPGRQRSQVEIEADIFAAEFLMPANQLRNIFSMIFGTEEFQVNRDSAFALGLKKLSALKDRLSTARRMIVGGLLGATAQ